MRYGMHVMIFKDATTMMNVLIGDSGLKSRCDTPYGTSGYGERYSLKLGSSDVDCP